MTENTNSQRVPLSTVRQLWGTAIDSGAYRVTATADSGREADWQEVRRFDVVGRASQPSILLEHREPSVIAKTLLAYRRLRGHRAHAGRLALAAAYRTGLPVPRRSVVLHELRGSSHGSTEPLTAIEHVLGEPFLAHIGVRTGANAKATAQLFSPSGDVLGYAKVAWNDITATYVRTETARLTSLAGTSGVLRTPRVRGVGEAFGMPFVILEPLPKDVTRLHKPTDLTVGDLSAISPIARFDHAASTAWFERLMARLENFREVPALRKVVGSVLDLADRLSADQTRLPVTAYDHGDLVPWNASRDRDGSLWVWDWESSEEDTVAGGDAIHWFVHSVSGPVPRDLAAAILRASELALPTHRAIGMGTHESRVATAAYALATADRACSLAAQHRTWARNRVGEDTVLDVIRLGKALLGHD